MQACYKIYFLAACFAFATTLNYVAKPAHATGAWSTVTTKATLTEGQPKPQKTTAPHTTALVTLVPVSTEIQTASIITPLPYPNCALLLLPTPRLHNTQLNYKHLQSFLAQNQHKGYANLKAAHDQGLKLISDQILSPLLSQFLSEQLQQKLTSSTELTSSNELTSNNELTSSNELTSRTELNLNTTRAKKKKFFWRCATAFCLSFASAMVSQEYLDGHLAVDFLIAGLFFGYWWGGYIAQPGFKRSLFSEKLRFDLDYMAYPNDQQLQLPQNLKCSLVLNRPSAQSSINYSPQQIQAQSLSLGFSLSCRPRHVLPKNEYKGLLQIQLQQHPHT